MQGLGDIALRHEPTQDHKIGPKVRQRSLHIGRTSALPGDEAELLERFRQERPDVRLAIDDANPGDRMTSSELRGLLVIEEKWIVHG